MFDTILIANRGEIAVRVIHTARRMGLATVAVHSDADAGSPHVRLADKAVRIGPAPAAESYLRADAIIEAALATGAGAIHPGYGFLSENPDFVEAVEAAGITFIGPDAAAIRAMGLKDAAKRLMEEAGVPVVPGYHGLEQDADLLAAEAARIGFPVLVKARAGGGGKGMRRVDRADDFAAALEGARREAQSAFGDPACLIEKYVQRPRHIEIQVFGDTHGNAVHLFERDCSLQRRHQKVIEEAPAPGMTDDMREAMGAAAVRAARAIAYRGAGTVEFIVDGSDGLRPDRFWFMEMNTRLQVEHPVTEAITGLDLVEWQIRVAAGEALPLAQEDIAMRGHAVEARIYAENPAKGFLPAIGTLDCLEFPAGVRVDSGVRQGDAVTPNYDPMIAKLTAHGESRVAALGRLRTSLRQTRICGLANNVAFLEKLVAEPDFRSGTMDTGLIERVLPSLLPPAEAPSLAYALAALVFQDRFAAPANAAGPWGTLDGFRIFGTAVMPIRVEIDGRIVELRSEGGDGHYRILQEGASHTVDIVERGPEPLVRIDGIARRFGWRRSGWTATLFIDGESYVATRPQPGLSDRPADGAGVVLSPMPGTVRVVSAVPGQAVERGAALIVVEAMKMEHTLTAPRDGIVEAVFVGVGDRADDGMVLLRLQEDDAA
ncbi:hypothetical protein LA66_14550 [Aureimonas altamirensis]|uniref:3-methylcrotonyl-CoA carboxylase n=1 Tax=Aureimonas altamirensis TaxID=370622 RepID=A0A0B1Q377_9HYPH|nr:acetyl/propionyl/methylcrotonyl-CoA carboxylase subunit alpha [Aureimonas altamirensis]KHJ53821.1 hypothetical protein LA66_14550 [Aureimonas altamirensis]